MELLKDIAAMANSGGGLIIIGRDEPDFRSGSIDEEAIGSFDPTIVNTFIHKYLAPPIECAITIEQVGSHKVVVLDIPGIGAAPVIFQLDGHCGERVHQRTPHFARADVYIRSKASQSCRIQDPSDMRDLLAIAARAQRDDVMIGIRREFEAMLRSMRELLEYGKSAPPNLHNESPPVSFLAQPIHEPLLTVVDADASYRDVIEHESREFFHAFFHPWFMNHGHYDLIVRPVSYRPDRLSLEDLPSRIRAYTAIVNRRGIFETVPYNTTNQIEQFRDGVRLKGRKLEFRRIEAASLQRSGLYRLVRAFVEDYQPNPDGSVSMVDTDRTLWIDYFVETVTLFHMLAAEVAKDLMAHSDDDVAIDFVVDGLAMRRPVGNKPDIDATLTENSIGQCGSENRFAFSSVMPARQFAESALKLARDRCAEIFWSFGLPASLVPQLQARLVPPPSSIAASSQS